MTILLDNRGSVPIYEQIFVQLRDQILRGDLQPGDPLPSIRGLAKDLRISFITTKRAYEELERAGFLNAIPGKGCYVAPIRQELLREEHLKKIEEHFAEVQTLAVGLKLSKEELLEMFRLSLEETL